MTTKPKRKTTTPRPSIQLTQEVRALLAAAKASRREASVLQRRYRDKLAVAVRKLADAGISMRDSAVILGMSHQRVAQILAKARTPAS